MARTWTSNRVVSAVVAAGLLMASQLITAPAFAAPRAAHRGASGAKKAGSTKIGSQELRPVGSVANKTRGTAPSIELNVDTTSSDASLSLISFTFTGGAPAKFAFGNRFTLSPDQAPFKLEAVAAFLAQRSDNSEGFQVGEPIGIDVFVDAASTGNIANAIPVFSGTATVAVQDDFNVYSLPNPIVVKQGDIYIMFADLTTDDESTELPIVTPDNGGSTDPRAYVGFSPGSADQPSSYALVSETLNDSDGNPLLGNFVIRGLGDPAEPTDLVTGGGEAVDSTLPAPTGLTAVGTSSVTLSWTGPTLPPPPPPTPVSEVEPNDSPATAQMIGTDDLVMGSAKDADPGAPGGFGEDDVEDWYKFTITSPTSITIDLTDFGASNDFDLLLYTPDGPFVSDSAVAFSGGGAGEDEHIAIDVLPAGTYVIAVSAFDPGVPSNQSYKLTVVAAPRVTRFNIYCGASENFTPSAQTFIGSVPGSQTNFTVNESTPGAYYIVTAVVGASQSAGSNSATGEPCEGGPTFTSVKAKRNGPGSITLKGGEGDLTGATLSINGVGFSKAPKVKASKHQIKQKGPLANGSSVGDACPAGCILRIETAAGCSTVVVP
jgi:hypothetical protein